MERRTRSKAAARKRSYARVLTIDDIRRASQHNDDSDDEYGDELDIEEEVAVDVLSDDEEDALETADVDPDEEIIDENIPEIMAYIGKDGKVWKSQPEQFDEFLDATPLLGNVMLTPGQHFALKKSYFDLFFDDKLLDIIVECTNREALHHKKDFHLIDKIELNAFIGLLIMCGIERKSKSNYEEFYGRLRGLPIFKATMSKSRFKDILRFIRYDDKSTRAERRQTDKLAAIRDIFDIVNENLKKYYSPGAYCTVDEQLVPFTGRCAFKQYMPKKPDRYGLKIFWLCDVDTHYPLNALPYLGNELL